MTRFSIMGFLWNTVRNRIENFWCDFCLSLSKLVALYQIVCRYFFLDIRILFCVTTVGSIILALVNLVFMFFLKSMLNFWPMFLIDGLIFVMGFFSTFFVFIPIYRAVILQKLMSKFNIDVDTFKKAILKFNYFSLPDWAKLNKQDFDSWYQRHQARSINRSSSKKAAKSDIFCIVLIKIVSVCLFVALVVSVCFLLVSILLIMAKSLPMFDIWFYIKIAFCTLFVIGAVPAIPSIVYYSVILCKFVKKMELSVEIIQDAVLKYKLFNYPAFPSWSKEDFNQWLNSQRKSKNKENRGN